MLVHSQASIKSKTSLSSHSPLETKKNSTLKNKAQSLANLPIKLHEPTANQLFPRPLTPKEALKDFSKYMDAEDKKDIKNYELIYFIRKQKIPPNATPTRHTDAFQFSQGVHIAFRYEQIQFLGRGVYGTVIKCYDHKEHKYVSLKILNTSNCGTMQHKMETEILELLNKNDENIDQEGKQYILNFIDKFEYRSYFVYVTELLFTDLFTHLKRFKLNGVSMKQGHSYALQIAKGLQYIARCGVVHADLKPENILFADHEDKKLKIIDFSCSFYNQNPIYKLVQTLAYRAPEVIFGFKYDKQIDVWSFGCILFQMYAGQPLFFGRLDKDVIKQIGELLGNPPLEMVKSSASMKQYFKPQQVNRKAANEKKREKIAASLGKNNQDLTDLISRCLEWLPSKRLTIDQILEHPFLTKEPIE